MLRLITRYAPFGLALLLLFSGRLALATTGPLETPLHITQMYMNNGQSVIYVSFQTGSMPGCYGNAGGYLYTSNSFFSQLYAQLLTMLANGGVKGMALYTVNASTGNWGDCTIDGLYLQPG